MFRRVPESRANARRRERERERAEKMNFDVRGTTARVLRADAKSGGL